MAGILDIANIQVVNSAWSTSIPEITNIAVSAEELGLDITVLEFGPGVRPSVDTNGRIDYAALPVGMSFAIFSDGSGGWIDVQGNPVTSRPATASHLHMVAYGGSAAPTFRVTRDVWNQTADVL